MGNTQNEGDWMDFYRSGPSVAGFDTAPLLLSELGMVEGKAPVVTVHDPNRARRMWLGWEAEDHPAIIEIENPLPS